MRESRGMICRLMIAIGSMQVARSVRRCARNAALKQVGGGLFLCRCPSEIFGEKGAKSRNDGASNVHGPAETCEFLGRGVNLGSEIALLERDEEI